MSRIGKACWYRTTAQGSRTPGPWRAGTLQAWGTDSEEVRDGVLHYPVGVIEDAATLTCCSVPVHGICFAATPPSEG